MASIDWSTMALGALVGIGCRKQLRACGRVAAKTAASLAGVAAQAAQQVADETQKTSQSPEEQAAAEWTQRMTERMNQQLAGQNAQPGFRPLIRGLSISSHRHHYIFSTKTDKFAICKPRAPPEFSKKFHLPAAANCLILRAKTTKHGLLA